MQLGELNRNSFQLTFVLLREEQLGNAGNHHGLNVCTSCNKCEKDNDMLKFENAQQAKQTARALEKNLVKKGLSLSHGEALDLVSQLAGCEGWNALAAALESPHESKETSRVPQVSDVDFTRLTAVEVNGIWYRVYSCDHELLPKLKE